MAVWTFVMGGAAVVGVLLSSVGVFLVWTTFDATRQANVIARDIGEKQVRAYIAVNVIETPQPAIRSDHVPKFEIAIKNVGQSPARQVRHMAFASIKPTVLPSPCVDLCRPKEGAVLNEHAMFTGDDFAGSVDNELAWKDILPVASGDGEQCFCIAGIVWYNDVFNNPQKRRFAFQLQLSEVKTTDGMLPVAHFALANSHNDET